MIGRTETNPMTHIARLSIVGITLLAALAFLALEDAPTQAQQKRVFRAGAHAQNINPQKSPVSVNGGMTDRQAKGASDPLHARCLVLDDGTTRLAIVVVDACMVPREITDEAKRLAQQA